MGGVMPVQNTDYLLYALLKMWTLVTVPVVKM